MYKQTYELLSLHEKNNCKSQKLEKLLDQEEIEKTPIAKNLADDNFTKIVTSGFEVFIGISCCQSMLYKTWLDASDQVSSKIQGLAETGITQERISSLHIEVCDDVFTSLFKSSEYASNLGRMINSAMNYMVAWKQYQETISSTVNADSESNSQEKIKNKDL